jgi:hypothetical protein
LTEDAEQELQRSTAMAVYFLPPSLHTLLIAAMDGLTGAAEAAGIFRKGEETRRLVPLRVIPEGKSRPFKPLWRHPWPMCSLACACQR